MELRIKADQLSAGAAYLSREWGECGYTITGVESPTAYVALLRVCASDGSRFTILADRWGNCRSVDTHHDDYCGELTAEVADMHAIATAA